MMSKGFENRGGCVDQFFTLRQIGEKPREKKNKECRKFLWDGKRHMKSIIRKLFGRC